MWTVLYVEDEETDVYFMRAAFRRASLEECIRVVDDGQVAMDYLSGRGNFGDRVGFPIPSVMLLDLNLPTVSGFQVLEWVRQQPAFQTLPVVIFSSSARPEDRLQAKRLRASDYFEKPDSGLAFGSIVDALHSKWPQQAVIQAKHARPPSQTGPVRLAGSP